MDKKSRIIVTVVAIVALLIAGLFGINFNPISAEEKAAAENQLTGTVYWTTYGHKYHLYDDCHTIVNSTKNEGSVIDAIDAGRTEVCYYCANKAEKAGVNMNGINVEEGVAELTGE